MLRRVSLILALLICGPTLAAERADTTAIVKALITKAQRGKTTLSVHFCDATTGKTIFAHKADTPLIPASNMKLMTTATALERLGSEFVYDTIFGLLGENLVIIGSGDPLTGAPDIPEQKNNDIFTMFAALVQELNARNIQTINGDMLIDDSLFDDKRFHPSWDPKRANNWYAAQISALNFNNNCLDVHIDPGPATGDPVTYRTMPTTQYVNITNKATTIKKGKNTVWGARKADTNEITLRGKSRTKQKFRVAIDRPSAYFGYVLAEYLFKHNITINGRLIVQRIREDYGALPPELDVIMIYRTKISDVLTACNQRSSNLAAECLLKTIAAKGSLKPTEGTWNLGTRVVSNFLTSRAIPPAQFRIDDGSGLSANNRLSARAITTVLTHMYNHRDRDLFRQSLSTPMVGTLKKKKRFASPLYRNRIYAKTGYISGARALSGYCQTTSGRWLAFSVIANNGTTNKTLDRLLMIMMGPPPAPK